MLNFKTKHFKTIILTKQKIITAVCIILLAGICAAAVHNIKPNPVADENQYSSSDDFHSMMISDVLPTDKRQKGSLKKLASVLLGFDPGNPETIFYDYSAQFHSIEDYADQTGTVYPSPMPQEAAKEKEQTPASPAPVEEKPISETSVSKGMSVSNATSYNVNASAFAAEQLPYTLDSNGPQILIVHTHTTESYTDSGKTKYTISESDRSTDESKNMIAVGNALAEVLNEKGIQTVHDTTVHDYPAYNGSYNRSKATVLANLKKHPSIKIVLDVHRDGIIRSDGTKVKVACDINGSKASQCMIVVGSDILLTHDYWRENMKLACKLQSKANEMYPGLMRPINLREQRFNQQLSKGALIIEVGSNGNTLNESVYSAKLFGNVIAALFNS